MTGLNFDVDFDGLPRLGYCSLEGLESLVELKDEAVPADQPAAQDAVSHSNIILRRGLDDSRDLWQWYAATRQGDAQPRNGTIVILNEARRPILTILVEGAWPCRWKLGRLDSIKGEVLVEEIELVVKEFNVK